jgi:tetratricopeptide (TPR) repeat protein
MSEIAGDKLVPLGSDEYYAGIEQFESNLSYILERCSEEKIPSMIGTLASNLLQDPLCKYSGCDSLVSDFNSAIIELDEDSREELEIIKDQDELRFRAPEEFNQVIINLSKAYSVPIFDVKKSFDNVSPFNIIGSNLMMDHLHPNFYGNELIAKSIFDQIEKVNIINTNLKRNTSPKIFNSTIPFKSYTNLDSIFADLRIRFLKNDFPFANPKLKEKFIFIPKNIEDSLAIQIIQGTLSWENAHIKLADSHLRKSSYIEYVQEMNVLIDDKPFDKYPYLSLIKTLETVKNDDLLLYVLVKYNNFFQDLYSTKKIGNLYFIRERNELALYYYQKCLELTNNDAEVYFNLSAIYFKNKNLPKALQNIQYCVKINPEYPKAKQILDALSRMYLGK